MNDGYNHVLFSFFSVLSFVLYITALYPVITFKYEVYQRLM